jgi:hypothetical protein
MIHRTMSLAAALLLGVAGNGALAAQEMSKGQLWLVHQEIARPSMVGEFEETTKEFVALVKQHKAVMPHFDFVCLQGEDLSYTFAVPIESIGAVDTINAEFGALAQAAGAKFAEVMSRSNAAIESVGEWVVREDPEHSYRPANPRLKNDELRYFAYDFYYLMPGKEEEAKAVAKDFVKLFAAKQIADGYRLFWSVMGPDMPMLFVAVGAKDAADLAQIDARSQQALGAEGQALFHRAHAVTRRYERQRAWLRPDLSILPARQ